MPTSIATVPDDCIFVPCSAVSVGFPSNSMMISMGTTARSWTRRIDIASRPCGASSSVRSARIRITTAVLLRVTMHPTAKAVDSCGVLMTRNMVMTMLTVEITCAAPRSPPRAPKSFSFAGVISRPMVKRSSDTPSSVMTSKRATSAEDPTRPRTPGPTSMPPSR